MITGDHNIPRKKEKHAQSGDHNTDKSGHSNIQNSGKYVKSFVKHLHSIIIFKSGK